MQSRLSWTRQGDAVAVSAHTTTFIQSINHHSALAQQSAHHDLFKVKAAAAVTDALSSSFSLRPDNKYKVCALQQCVGLWVCGYIGQPPGPVLTLFTQQAQRDVAL